jgi:hypothetical protein
VHVAANLLAQAAVGRQHLRHDHVVAVGEVHAAPLAEGDGLRGVHLHAVEVEAAHRAAVHREPHLVARRVLHGDLDARDRGQAALGRPQQGNAGREPLDGQFRFARRGRRGRPVGRGRLRCCRRLRRRRGGGAFGRRPLAQHEVGAPERAATQVHELREGTARVAHAPVAERDLERRGHGDRVELHHVRAGRHALEVVLALRVRDRVATVLEVDAYAGHARATRRLVAAAAVHPTDDDGLAAVELLAQADAGARLVRPDAAGRGLRDVDEFVAARGHGDLGHVAQRDARARRERAGREAQRLPIRIDGGIRRAVAVEAGRARAIAHAARQPVGGHHRRERSGGAGVLDHQRVAHEVAGGGHGRGRGLRQEQRGAGRVERHVHHGRQRSGHVEGVAIGARTDAVRRARQSGNLLRRRGRRMRVAGAGHDLEPVGAGRDQREAEHARREGVDGAARVGHRGARYDLGGIGAHAVVTDDVGRLPGRGLHEAHAHAVHGCAGAGVEHSAERVDECIGRGGVLRVGGIDVAHAEFGVAQHLQHAVAGHCRTGGGLHVADELAGVGARLGEAQALAVARRRGQLELDVVCDARVAILVGVHEAEEHRLAAVHERRGIEGHGHGGIDGLAVREHRWRQGRKAVGAAALRRSAGARRTRTLRRSAQDRDRGTARRRRHGERHGVRLDGLAHAGGEAVLDRGDVAQQRARRSGSGRLRAGGAGVQQQEGNEQRRKERAAQKRRQGGAKHVRPALRGHLPIRGSPVDGGPAFSGPQRRSARVHSVPRSVDGHLEAHGHLVTGAGRHGAQRRRTDDELAATDDAAVRVGVGAARFRVAEGGRTRADRDRDVRGTRCCSRSPRTSVFAGSVSPIVTPVALTVPVFASVIVYSTVAPGMAFGLVVPLNGSLTTDEVFCTDSAADCTAYWSESVSELSRPSSANTTSTAFGSSGPTVSAASVAAVRARHGRLGSQRHVGELRRCWWSPARPRPRTRRPIHRPATCRCWSPCRHRGHRCRCRSSRRTRVRPVTSVLSVLPNTVVPVSLAAVSAKPCGALPVLATVNAVTAPVWPGLTTVPPDSSVTVKSMRLSTTKVVAAPLPVPGVVLPVGDSRSASG